MKTITVFNQDGTVAKQWLGVGRSEMQAGPFLVYVIYPLIGTEPMGIQVLAAGQWIEYTQGVTQ